MEFLKILKKSDRSYDTLDQDPEHIGFIKLVAYRLRLANDQIIALNKVDYTQETAGVLLGTSLEHSKF